MMRSVERDRRRSGAEQWGLFRDLADTDRFVETFVVDTWGEHLRQHERRTRTADVMLQRAREFVEGDVEVAHLISAYSEAGLTPVETTERAPDRRDARAAEPPSPSPSPIAGPRSSSNRPPDRRLFRSEAGRCRRPAGISRLRVAGSQRDGRRCASSPSRTYVTFTSSPGW